MAETEQSATRRSRRLAGKGIEGDSKPVHHLSDTYLATIRQPRKKVRRVRTGKGTPDGIGRPCESFLKASVTRRKKERPPSTDLGGRAEGSRVREGPVRGTAGPRLHESGMGSGGDTSRRPLDPTPSARQGTEAPSKVGKGHLPTYSSPHEYYIGSGKGPGIEAPPVFGGRVGFRV